MNENISAAKAVRGLNGGNMYKFIKNLKLSALLILGGIILPALLSIIFSGFRISLISIVSYEFFVGIIMAVIGGILIVYDFTQFREKVLKTPIDVEVSEDEEPGKIDWPHVLFFSGVSIVLVAIAIGEIR
ncbi:MAG: hypothetical protein A2Y23_08610 [Clostridiales bacterium GWB2_37_7]|nr:MAG: hypothetical protein A2Y23_08610 [Clostridiales bacterium GWB2_37_7]